MYRAMERSCLTLVIQESCILRTGKPSSSVKLLRLGWCYSSDSVTTFRGTAYTLQYPSASKSTLSERLVGHSSIWTIHFDVRQENLNDKAFLKVTAPLLAPTRPAEVPLIQTSFGFIGHYSDVDLEAEVLWGTGTGRSLLRLVDWDKLAWRGQYRRSHSFLV